MRQVKFLKVRLGPSALKADESWLNQFLASVKTRKIVPSLVQTPREVFWSLYVEFDVEPEAENKRRASPKGQMEPVLPADRMPVYDALRAWRAQKAVELSYPSFVILHNKHLRSIAVASPTSLQELAAIPGIGEAKASRFGREILGVIQQT